MKRIFAITLLLLIPLVMASTPNNQVEQLFDDEVVNGVNDIGSLLFVANQYNPDTYEVDDFVDVSVQKYDKMIWNGSESVSVLNPIFEETVLIQGSQYYFTRQGTYQVNSLTNSSHFFYIDAQPEFQNNVIIEPVDIPNGMEVNLSDDNFILSDEKTIDATLFIDDDVSPGDYTIEYEINNIPYNYSFEVLENSNWTIANVTFEDSYKIKSGEDKYLGKIITENLGNVDVEISLTKEGNNSNIIIVQRPQTLYKKSNRSFDVELQVPSIIEAGVYDYSIIVSGDGRNFTVPLEVEVLDAQLPIIESINFSTDRAFVDNDISVYAYDNDDIEQLILSYGSKNVELEKDANLFTTTIKFEKLSEYNFKFCAIDTSGNKGCEEINKTFEKSDSLEGVPKSVALPVVKVGTYAKKFLFNLTENLDEPIVVELIDIDANIADSEQDYTLRIVDEDGGVKRFDTYDNSIEIDDKGTYSISMKSEKISEYEGTIRINVPEYIQEVDDISFTAAFRDYELDDSFTLNDVYGNDVLCEAFDENEFSRSYYLCNLKIPANIKKEDIVIPLTVQEKERLEGIAGEVEKDLQQTKRRSATFIGILIAIIFGFGAFLYFIIEIYPYIRAVRQIKDD